MPSVIKSAAVMYSYHVVCEDYDSAVFVVLDSRTGSQVLARFMGVVMGGRVKFEPSQMVLTAGATPTIEILAFSLAQPGEAFLVPSPYYAGCVLFVHHSLT